MSYTPPPPPPPPMQGGPGMPGGYAQPQTNQKAMWSMILGNLAKKEINASGGAQTGGGMATAGVILGIIAIVWSIISGILFATGVVTFDN